jgi:hypothetical protein
MQWFYQDAAGFGDDFAVCENGFAAADGAFDFGF